MNKTSVAIKERIGQLEEQLKEAKENAINNISDVNDARMGITKYSEQVSIILAKIEAYKDTIGIIKFYED